MDDIIHLLEEVSKNTILIKNIEKTRWDRIK